MPNHLVAARGVSNCFKIKFRRFQKNMLNKW